MSYYRGDYYQGDYYQGFPIGLIAGLGRKLIPKVGTAIGRGVAKIVRKPGRVIVPTVGTTIAVGAGRRIGRRQAEEEMMGRRSRRMNVGNTKALRRAIRRAHGFAKLARKVLSFPISRPPKGRPLFKKAGRR